MPTASPAALAGVILMAFVLSSAAMTRDHSAFTGTWTLIPAKCTFSGQPVLRTARVTIVEDRHVTIVKRRLIDEAGTVHDGNEPNSRVKWEGDVLKVTTIRDGVTTTETYTFAEDSMTALIDGPEGRPITLVFARK
ncbi:MAG TPA: hypothetical protein VGN17_06005 [Bryobacteraceae bacterium]|jgi:hypothetical protein